LKSATQLKLNRIAIAGNTIIIFKIKGTIISTSLFDLSSPSESED